VMVRVSPVKSTFFPSEVSSLIIVRVSRKRGTFLITQGSSVRRVAARIGRVAFLDPLIFISPFRGRFPSIINFSINFSLVKRPAFRF